MENEGRHARMRGSKKYGKIHIMGMSVLLLSTHKHRCVSRNTAHVTNNHWKLTELILTFQRLFPNCQTFALVM